MPTDSELDGDATNAILARKIASKPVYRRHIEKPDDRNLFLYGYAPHIGNKVPGKALEIQAGSELRKHPLLGSWAIYAAGRNNRTFKPSAAKDPLAPSQVGLPLTEIPFSEFELCVFENRFPSLHQSSVKMELGSTYCDGAQANGQCEVVVYAPQSDGNMASIGQDKRRLLIEAWIDRYQANFAAGHCYVLPFENRGDEVGVTLGHPHGQIYAFPFVPEPQAKAAAAFKAGFSIADRLEDWMADYGIAEAGGLVAYAPPFARFPYEIWISPRTQSPGPWMFDETQSDGFAHLLGLVAERYDALFQRPTPYMMTLQAAPQLDDKIFEFTTQFYPLLRAPDRVKYLGAVEQATNVFTVEVMPEAAAQDLREIKA